MASLRTTITVAGFALTLGLGLALPTTAAANPRGSDAVLSTVKNERQARRRALAEARALRDLRLQSAQRHLSTGRPAAAAKTPATAQLGPVLRTNTTYVPMLSAADGAVCELAPVTQSQDGCRCVCLPRLN